MLQYFTERRIDMIEDKNLESIQNKPRVETYRRKEDNSIRLSYSGDIIIDTLENQKKLRSELVNLEKIVNSQKEKIESLKNELIQVKMELKKEKENAEKANRKFERLREHWRAFEERQGKGRPTVLTDNCLKTIHLLCTDERYSVTEVYEILQKQGYKGGYETVRKYIQNFKERCKNDAAFREYYGC